MKVYNLTQCNVRTGDIVVRTYGNLEKALEMYRHTKVIYSEEYEFKGEDTGVEWNRSFFGDIILQLSTSIIAD